MSNKSVSKNSPQRMQPTRKYPAPLRLDPRFTAAKAFSTATAGCAKNFLDKLLTAFPFKIAGIQVDGGSEFMAEFEQACHDKGLTLFVLPPKRPDLNGAVERAQSSWR